MELLSGFSGGSVVKNLPAHAGEHGFNPWVRKIPWKRKWQPTPVFLPGKLDGQRSMAGYRSWSCKRIGTASQLKNCTLGRQREGTLQWPPPFWSKRVV